MTIRNPPVLEPIKDHDLDVQGLTLDTVIVNPRVQARLSAIDARAKRGPQRATRQ
jgi:hypothetical protein